MMPEASHKMIRSVYIHYHHNYITGFKFYDKDKKLILEIGDTWEGLWVKKVLIAENEVIVGVVCKLYPGRQSMYSDF